MLNSSDLESLVKKRNTTEQNIHIFLCHFVTFTWKFLVDHKMADVFGGSLIWPRSDMLIEPSQICPDGHKQMSVGRQQLNSTPSSLSQKTPELENKLQKKTVTLWAF